MGEETELFKLNKKIRVIFTVEETLWKEVGEMSISINTEGDV